MADHLPETDYRGEIEAICADTAMISAMRQRMPNSADEINPAVRAERWREAVETFCTADASWWEVERPRGK